MPDARGVDHEAMSNRGARYRATGLGSGKAAFRPFSIDPLT